MQPQGILEKQQGSVRPVYLVKQNKYYKIELQRLLDKRQTMMDDYCPIQNNNPLYGVPTLVKRKVMLNYLSNRKEAPRNNVQLKTKIEQRATRDIILQLS